MNSLNSKHIAEGMCFAIHIALSRMPLRESNWDSGLYDMRLAKKWMKVVDVYHYTTNHYLKFKPYINHISSYAPYLNELKTHLFCFRKSHSSEAHTILHQYGYNTKPSSRIFISIHVRLTDYITVLEGLPRISKKYFTKAMEYFTNRYKVCRLVDVCLLTIASFTPFAMLHFILHYCFCFQDENSLSKNNVSRANMPSDTIVFYVISDNVDKARKMLMKKANKKFKIVFPTEGKTSAGKSHYLI